MSDRELLELAAKAAGIEWHGFFGDDHTECLFLDIGVDETVEWNPLDDDGDALRLAVKCEIHLNWGAGTSDGKLVFADEIDEPCSTDPCAATRRAITRAAAEIGRNMK